MELDDIVRIVVAAGFVAAADAKLLLSRERLARMGMRVVAELSGPQRVGIAVFELLGVVGLLAPWVFGAPAWTVQVAALALSALMVGASWIQLTRRNSVGAAVSLVMLTLTASLAVTPTVPVGLS